MARHRNRPLVGDERWHRPYWRHHPWYRWSRWCACGLRWRACRWRPSLVGRPGASAPGTPDESPVAHWSTAPTDAYPLIRSRTALTPGQAARSIRKDARS